MSPRGQYCAPLRLLLLGVHRPDSPAREPRDRPELLREVVHAAREAGATHLWANLLHLRPGTREHFLDHLAEDWPEEAQRYERLYAHGAYLKKEAVAPVQGLVAELRREHEIADRRRVRWSPPPEPEQLALAV